MILILDNYDSFTYNLYQVFLKLKYKIKVVRSDKISISQIEKINPSYIVLSPGPGTPKEAGVCIEVVRKLKGCGLGSSRARPVQEAPICSKR